MEPIKINVSIVAPYKFVTTQQGYAKGVKGDKGDEGLSAYEIAVKNGFVGTESEWVQSLSIKNYVNKYDFIAPYNYCGVAIKGALETADDWIITRIQINANGTNTTTKATNVAWSDRLTVIYT